MLPRSVALPVSLTPKVSPFQPARRPPLRRPAVTRANPLRPIKRALILAGHRYFLPGLRGSGGGGYAAMAGAKPLGEALRLNAERSLQRQPEAEGPRL